jgi:hypothetical protein
MLWLQYAFFALMVVVGGAAFVILLRAKQLRAWIWALIALVGVVGIVGVAMGRTDGEWRSLTLAATFDFFAADHFLQYAETRRAGAPKKAQLGLGLGWVCLGTLTLL